MQKRPNLLIMSDLHRYFDKKVIFVIVFSVNLYITKLIIPIIIFAIYIIRVL